MKTVDMSDEMEKDAIEVATFALFEFMQEKDMANHIKKEFDKKYRCGLRRPVAPCDPPPFFSTRRAPKKAACLACG